MDFSEGFCTEKFLHPQNSQRGVQAEDPGGLAEKKKKNGKSRGRKKKMCGGFWAGKFLSGTENMKFWILVFFSFFFFLFFLGGLSCGF